MTDQLTIGPAAKPDMCRVSVIGGNTQVDLGLPATIPIATFITRVVELIESRNPVVAERDDDAPLEVRHWTLSRLGRRPIPPHQTLTDAEVFDGELLVLRSVATPESPALFDDVIDAVARLTGSAFRGWSPAAARWIGVMTAVLATPAAGAMLILAKSHRQGIAAASIALGVGVVALIAAGIAAHRFAATIVSTALSLCGLALVFLAAVLYVPDPIGSAHLLLGCAVVLVVGVIGLRVTTVGAVMYSAVLTAAVLGGVAAAVVLGAHVPPAEIGAGAVVVALALISAAPRLAVAASRLPVPPVPTAGGAIDPADHEPRPTVEGVGAIGATALPSAAGLEQRARAANQYQTGMVLAATLASAAGALAAADAAHGHRWQGIALAAIVGVVLCLRGRAFADLAQAAILVGGGCVTFIALGVELTAHDHRMLLPAAGALLLVAAAAVGFGAIGPHITVSPVQRRLGEILEYLLIIAIIPLVFWILDLYSAARGI